MTNPLAVAPREKTVTLYPGDTGLEIERLRRLVAEKLADAAEAVEQALSEQASRGPRRQGEKPPDADEAGEADRRAARGYAEELDALVESTRGRVVVLAVRGVPSSRFRAIQAAHPPAKDNPRDRIIGAAERPFLRDLLRASLVSPEVTDAEFADAVDGWSETNWRLATDAAYEVNAGEPVSLPKQSMVSLLPSLRETAESQAEPTA